MSVSQWMQSHTRKKSVKLKLPGSFVNVTGACKQHAVINVGILAQPDFFGEIQLYTVVHKVGIILFSDGFYYNFLFLLYFTL